MRSMSAPSPFPTEPRTATHPALAPLPAGLVASVLAALGLAGCGAPPPSPEAMNRAYEQALERTRTAAVELAPGDPTRRARAGLEEFLALGEGEIPARALQVYAPDAWLDDNLAIVEGAPAIGAYFAASARRVRSLRVEMLGVTHDGVDYFARWRMTVDAPRLRAEGPLVSYGMTHFRFNAAGQVLLHRDYWDAGTGLYEYLPGVGSIVRRVRASATRD
jgi:hypothetical protein